jgi:hypothetical protein
VTVGHVRVHPSQLLLQPMDYFSKFLRPSANPPPKLPVDRTLEFTKSWTLVKVQVQCVASLNLVLIFLQEVLQHPDERQLTKGILSTNVPAHLQSMVDSLVWESTRTEEGYGG